MLPASGREPTLRPVMLFNVQGAFFAPNHRCMLASILSSSPLYYKVQKSLTNSLDKIPYELVEQTIKK